jgi:UDP-N-acetylglucosamine 2-epimerase (non-hydrolysing)/GDP/UDP-N,N'-diacetylbacillosamine 2-epimerase (hydrolysing)
MKRKITVTTGTRAEFGILRPILKNISQNKNLELILIVTGTHLSKNHGMSINEIKKDGIKISHKFNMLPSGNTNYDMSLNLGKGIEHFSKLFKKIKPDINLILGDRDEMLASAIAAYHMNIPNAHIHGGDKSKGGIDEYTRHAITKMSNIHFAATNKSYLRIIKMGEDPKYVYHTGSPSIDEILSNKITPKISLEKKYNIKLTGNEIILLYHPVTTQSNLARKNIENILKVLARLKIPIISIAPNNDAGNKEIREKLLQYSKKYDLISYYQNFPRSDFLGLIKNAGMLVGNSSAGIIEASYFKIPVVNVGIRQNGREHGKNVINSDEKSVNLSNAISNALKIKSTKQLSKSNIYGNGTSSKKIVKTLEKIKLNEKLIQKQISY